MTGAESQGVRGSRRGARAAGTAAPLAGLEARLHGLGAEEAGRRLAYGTLVGGDDRYVFTETPKAACTTLKWLLAHIEGRHPTPRSIGVESSLAMSIHSPAVHGFPSLMSLEPARREALLGGADVVRFCVVRNPYTRVLSAWAEKVRQREPRYAAVWEKVAAHGGTDPAACPSFRQFVAWLTETEDVRRCNHHWRGMTWLLLPDLLRPTDVLRTESLAADLAGVLARIAPGEDAAALLRRFTANESLPLPDPHAMYDEDTAARVHSFYREDFERFGYARDSWRPPEGAGASATTAGEFARVLEQRALEILRARNDLLHEQSAVARALHRFATGRGETADLLRDLAADLLRTGDAPRARALLETARSLRPQGSAIRLLLARSLVESGLADEARPHLESLVGDERCGPDAAALLQRISAL